MIKQYQLSNLLLTEQLPPRKAGTHFRMVQSRDKSFVVHVVDSDSGKVLETVLQGTLTGIPLAEIGQFKYHGGEVVAL